ncbi:alpha/beta hydrolase [Actinoplanes sp. SE50]|uniref:alpha/beta hydrolase fold domain-containing protein n=1 Tax=unclassified Actinoplanes TaxID=2626549 RepID=UPI00023EC264|nr:MULTISPECIES: alpha/beta hydrolase fold domain-containing protein [unclassified Actinoplanes]AEV83566.1 alpha/beta hydrolase fold-3 domain protein [Actinoplanes sp. SE50/110]ATO82290.1 alpha/beta hydrolase [Actinoplanes sp. SE50]SLL99697.1 alpha/beta hydrolase [Actinoplanes sp. SE50/110]
MTEIQVSGAVPRQARARATFLGYAMKALRSLPRPVQRAVLNGAAAGELPPVADFVRMLEIAGDLPETGPTHAELLARFPALAAVEVTDPAVDGVPARLYRLPGHPAEAALIWVHGGAFVRGDLAMPEAHWTGLTLAARGIPVLSLDYRKALHGVRFPAPSDDVLTGWSWAVNHPSLIGVPAAKMHLGGASAGASLAAGVAKRLRDGEGRPPATVVLAYPAVHPELTGWDEPGLAAIRDNHSAVYFSPGWIRDLSAHYAGPDRLTDPYAFPGLGDLTGTPPTLIVNCGADTLRRSGELYTEQLRAAGVAVTSHLLPDAPHGTLNDPFSDAGVRTADLIAGWLVPK